MSYSCEHVHCAWSVYGIVGMQTRSCSVRLFACLSTMYCDNSKKYQHKVDDVQRAQDEVYTLPPHSSKELWLKLHCLRGGRVCLIRILLRKLNKAKTCKMFNLPRRLDRPVHSICQYALQTSRLSSKVNDDVLSRSDNELILMSFKLLGKFKKLT